MSVATVSSSGLVTAVSPGTATITVTTVDGNYSANCTVTVTNSISGTENGHDYVDLGLPSGVKWATCNVGASSPEKYGSYYAWGEITTKSDYSWSSYKWCNGNEYTLTKYNNSSSYGSVDYRMRLELSDDAARANWGGRWRMPSKEDFEELVTECIWTKILSGKEQGYRVTSKKNGNSIFLPRAGTYYGTDESNYFWGSYWSSTLSSLGPLGSSILSFLAASDMSDQYDVSDMSRQMGLSVRPVFKEKEQESISVTSVRLDKTQLSLTAGQSTQLTATVLPSNATNKSVSWKSSSTSVATVSSSGLVTAVSPGTATITVTTVDGNYSANCTVTVTSSSNGYENGHEYVDLGLPSGVKWATCNIGANSPEEYGNYYAWGETTTKSDYSWSNYKWGNSITIKKYNINSNFGSVDNRLILELSDDVAYANWGGKWRMPIVEEWAELFNNCTSTWTTQNGVNGRKFTSKKNGNSIFLPAAGCRGNGYQDNAGFWGYYWSSRLYNSYTEYANDVAISSDKTGDSVLHRYVGLSVRPVYRVSCVRLEKSQLSLSTGQSAQLTVTVLPDNETNKSVSWKSSSTSVATVSSNGWVTAVSPGTAIITVTTMGGNNSANCTVTVTGSSYDGYENGHKYVDLGLSVKWATCNVGASSPEEYGSYYAWGETVTKSYYDWSSYKWCKGYEWNLTKYNKSSSSGSVVDNRTLLELSDDAAYANWGGKWRMPTDAEWTELLNNCTSTWATQYGVYGCRFTSKINGNGIFLPAAGILKEGGLIFSGSDGSYWSSMLYQYGSTKAGGVTFHSGGVSGLMSNRCFGLPVRPVIEK